MHPRTAYILQQYSLDQTSFFDKLAKQQLGRPYKWAQTLCGLEFITCNPTSTIVSHESTQTTVPKIIHLIRNRLQSRLILFKQVHALETKDIDQLDTAIDGTLLARLSCSLVQWTAISWPEYENAFGNSTITAKFIEAGVVTTHHLLYCAVIIRGSAKLQCLISVPPSFPHDVPLWAISLCWSGNHNAETNTDIRVSEKKCVHV